MRIGLTTVLAVLGFPAALAAQAPPAPNTHTYKLEQSVATTGGQTVLNLKVTQSGVSDGFKMLVPLYVELADSRVVRLGSATMAGNRTIEQQIPLGQVPVKRVLLNHYYDVLALEEKESRVPIGHCVDSFSTRHSAFSIA